jgi:hypothetical protein
VTAIYCIVTAAVAVVVVVDAVVMALMVAVVAVVTLVGTLHVARAVVAMTKIVDKAMVAVNITFAQIQRAVHA